MKKKKFKNKKMKNRWRRKMHIRRNLEGTADRPRLSVFKSLKHIYAQAIDDMSGRTLCAASTLTPEIRDEVEKKKGAAKKEDGFTKTNAAELVGKHIAGLLKDQGIEKICFDRGGFKYHGRVKALADAARKEGLNF